MTTEQEGVSPASVGGAPAPVPEPFRRMFWIAAEDIANKIGCTVVEGKPRGYAAPLPPFKRRAVLDGPKLNMDGDEDGNTWPDGVGWALSWGCQLTFGRDDETGEPTVVVNMSDDDLRRGITSRTAKRHQVAEFARMLVEQFGEPAGPDPRDAEIERLRKEYDEVLVSGVLRETLNAEIERLRGKVVELEGIRQGLFGEVRTALNERDEAREEWKRADAEVTRLKRLVGNENVEPNWKTVDRREAIRQAIRFHDDLQAVMQQRNAVVRQLGATEDEVAELVAERDRLRAELDLIGEKHAGGLTVLLKDFTAAVNGLMPISPEPRRWRAGDPEPEIGTTVSFPDWTPGDPTWTRHPAGGWQKNGVGFARLSWGTLLQNCGVLVEVASADG